MAEKLKIKEHLKQKKDDNGYLRLLSEASGVSQDKLKKFINNDNLGIDELYKINKYIEDVRLNNAVNYSGFPLQIGIENEVVKTSQKHGWNLAAKEHAWKNGTSSGFIDLILEKKTQFATGKMVIECKRNIDTEWIFLVPSIVKPIKIASYSKAWLTGFQQKARRQINYFGWTEIEVEPDTLESEFCIISPPQNKNNYKDSKELLEHLSGPLVESTESFAFEDYRLVANCQGKAECCSYFYFNVIVTTANLNVCFIDPNNISLSDGKTKKMELIPVPYIRFRKQLSNNDVSLKILSNDYRQCFNSLVKERENTVYIVNSTNFIDFLKNFSFPQKSTVPG